jgi:protein phosphatase
MKFLYRLDVAGVSDVGKHRSRNEDAIDFDASRGIMVLADGMGGHQAGNVASELAVLSILADLKYTLRKRYRFKNALLKRRENLASFQSIVQTVSFEAQKITSAVQSANNLIYQVSQNQPQFSGMATTLLLSVFTRDKVYVGHVGDSRMYRCRQQTLEQLTEDHSLVQAQINAGWLPPEYARISVNKNLVTRALGLDEAVDLTLNSFDVKAGDRYLLCSDGLTDAIQDTEILTVLTKPKKIQSIAQELVNLANRRGGKDNISVILVEVKNRFFSRNRIVKNS